MSSIDEYDNGNVNEDENVGINENEENVSIDADAEASCEGHAHYQPKKEDGEDDTVKYQLSGMYQNWFLDYASYVILERAVHTSTMA